MRDTFQRFLRENPQVFFFALVSLLLLIEGCGGPDIYAPPEGTEAANLVLINEIYKPGFYVEIDEQDAGFLNDQREIRIEPGKHNVKIFNHETTVTEEAFTTTHTFEFDVKVNERDSSVIELAWDDPNYRKKVESAAKSIRPDDEEKAKERRRSGSSPGMNSPY